MYFLAKKGYITNVGDVITALKDFYYAKRWFPEATELKDDIKEINLETLKLKERRLTTNHLQMKRFRRY